MEIEERGVKLRLTVVDTPGYGDAINSQDWLEPWFPPSRALLLLKQTLTACSRPRPASAPSSATSTTSLNATSTTRAASIADTLLTIGSTAASISSPRLATGEWRRGCCLPALPPLYSSYLSSCFCRPSLKPLDVQFMKAIHNKVNVVPVIAKADTLTLRERERLKRRVRATVAHCSPNKQQQPSRVDGLWVRLPRTENPLFGRNSSCGCF